MPESHLAQHENLAAPWETRPRRIAIVHDWLVTFAGAERVLAEILSLFPDADLFSIVDFLTDEDRRKIQGKRAHTSFIQNLPLARRRYRSYLPLMPIAVEQFNLSDYDLIISSSHAVAKGVIVAPHQRHVCYCHTPIRYAWDLQHRYLKEAGLNSGAKAVMARIILHYMRLWDVRTAHGVDQFIANSAYIAQRIRRIYGKDSAVVYPPVDVDYFVPGGVRENFYLTASRMVPYKCIDIIVEAFRHMKDRQLIVIGDGPDRRRIEKLAGDNVTLLGYQPDEVLKSHLQRARAFIFAAEEDFGILPLEAQACGTPVIAFGKGGARETVVESNAAAEIAATGLLFDSQTAASVIDAVERFEETTITPEACRDWASRFSPQLFQARFKALVAESAAAIMR